MTFSFISNSDGPIATAYYLKKIIFDENSKLINGKGEPYIIVHQYDKRWIYFLMQLIQLKKIYEAGVLGEVWCAG